MRFYKYHALGNDYLVLDPADYPAIQAPSPAHIRVICHRNFGVGSDGILWVPSVARRRLWPPHLQSRRLGSGKVRQWPSHLFPVPVGQARVATETFAIDTPGAWSRPHHRRGRLITIDLGSVSFNSARIPLTGIPREVLGERLWIRTGNSPFARPRSATPIASVPLPEVSAELARQYGPAIENHPLFPRRTNVQFLQVLDRNNIRIEIWERGAGYTLASGSSSSAAAAVAHRLDLVDRHVSVHMPGGTIGIEIGRFSRSA